MPNYRLSPARFLFFYAYQLLAGDVLVQAVMRRSIANFCPRL